MTYERITYIQNNSNAQLGIGTSNQNERIFVNIDYSQNWPKLDGLHAIQTYGDEVEVEWCCHKGLSIGNSNGANGLPTGFIQTLRDKYQQQLTELAEAEAEEQPLEE